jgi:hypothetical protein
MRNVRCQTEALSYDRVPGNSQVRSHRKAVIAAFAFKENLRMDRKPWSFAHDRRVIELAKASKPLEEAVRIMKCTPERIRKDAMRLRVSFKGARKAERAAAAQAQRQAGASDARSTTARRAKSDGCDE